MLERAFGFSSGLADNMDRVYSGGGAGGEYGGGRYSPKYGPMTEPMEGFAKGTSGPVLVRRDMIARVHAGEGLLRSRHVHQECSTVHEIVRTRLEILLAHIMEAYFEI